MLRGNGKHNIQIMPITNNINRVSSIYEWIKRLEYIPDFEKKKVEKLNKMNEEELSDEDISYLRKHTERVRILSLIKKYKSKYFDEDEGMKAYLYMDEKSISELILDRLDAEELNRRL